MKIINWLFLLFLIFTLAVLGTAIFAPIKYLSTPFPFWGTAHDLIQLKQKKLECQTLYKEIADIKKMRITNSIAEAIRDCQKEGAWPEESEK